MKRVFFKTLAIFVAITLFMTGIAACSDLTEAAANKSTAAHAEATPVATPAETPNATATATKIPIQTPVAAAMLPDGFSVISDGEVCGGYLNGKWLTNGEAARYLDAPVTLYSYNLLGEGETVESSGVCFDDDEYTNSGAIDNPIDGSGVYTLEIDGYWGGDAFSYTSNPLEFYYLYNLGPECLPDITAVEDTSEAESIIQDMLDGQFGKDAPEAEIIIAFSADIDADGGQETVVNAANNEDNVYEYYCDKNLYCISCIIEDDGKVVVIEEYYLDSGEAQEQYYSAEYDEEYGCEEGDDISFYSDVSFFYVQNIIDLDHDGICEIVMNFESYEYWTTLVYDYEDREFTMVLYYGWGV